MLLDHDMLATWHKVKLAWMLLSDVFGPRRAPHPDDWVAVDDPDLERFEPAIREAIARDELVAYPLDKKGSCVAVRRGDLDAWIEARRGKPRAPRPRAVDQAEAEVGNPVAPGLLEQLGLEAAPPAPRKAAGGRR